MKERSKKISRLMKDESYRYAYVKAKLNVLIPSQIRALRIKSKLLQSFLARITVMKQSWISAMETTGMVNFNLETLVRIAASFKVGLKVKFVSHSEMLDWENKYSQDAFDVTRLDDDRDFLYGKSEHSREELEMAAGELLNKACTSDMNHVDDPGFLYELDYDAPGMTVNPSTQNHSL